MIRRPRARHRHWLAAGAALIALTGAGIWIADKSNTPPGGRVTSTSTSPTVHLHRPVARRPTGTASGDGTSYRPRYVTVPQTARQEQFDSQLSRSESPTQIAAAEAMAVPRGRYSASYRPVSGSDTTDEFVYADAWVRELLDTNFASQSREDLLAWAVAGEAANTLPGVPASVADKALYGSLADPTLGGGSGASPVPTPALWASEGRDGVEQDVSAVTANVDPSWTRLVSAGFVDPDPLFAVLDVTGTLTVRKPRQAGGAGKGAYQVTSRETFRLKLTVGSALHHPGYGAVAVDDWTAT